MKRCKHDWKDAGKGYFDGASYCWCKKCGALSKGYGGYSRITSPKYYLKRR